MRKTFIILSLALASLTMTSCIVTRSTAKINKVEIGMSKKDISKLLGTPYYRNGWQDGEQWGFKKFVGDIAGVEPILFMVTFDTEGKVVEYETVKEFPPMPMRY